MILFSTLLLPLNVTCAAITHHNSISVLAYSAFAAGINGTILKLQQRGSIMHCSAAAEEAEASIVAMSKNAATHSAEHGSGAALQHVVSMHWLTRDMHSFTWATGVQASRHTCAHVCACVQGCPAAGT